MRFGRSSQWGLGTVVYTANSILESFTAGEVQVSRMGKEHRNS
jgi:hypothetical protein